MKYGGVTASTLYGPASSGTNYNQYFNYFADYPSFYCPYPQDSANHQVTIIGWDDNYSVDNFKNKPNKPGAYLVLNSHGKTSNFPNGCYYISYEDENIETAIVGVQSAGDINYNNIYEYDPLGICQTFSLEGYNTIYGANVYTKNANKIEKLTEVGVSMLSNVNCEVYVNSIDGDLNSSKLQKVKNSIISLHPGYNTIRLDNPVLLTGNKFAVVIKYMVDNSDAKIGVESPYYAYWATATSNLGESYIGTSLNSWKDLNNYNNMENTNICIKAFTENIESDIITSNYTINEQNYIMYITPGTKINNFISNNYINGSYVVKNSKGETVSADANIATGMQLIINGNSTYTFVTKGDLNGDGLINIVDVSFMKQHMIELRNLTGPYLLASDMNGNNRYADISDFSILLDVHFGLRSL